MLCQNCQLKPAVFHFARVINGVKQENHLCAACFEEMREENEAPVSEGLGGSLLESILFGLPARPRTLKRCSTCGWTMADVSKTGKLGCPACYETFSAELSPTLRRLAAGENHKGRTPKKTVDVKTEELHDKQLALEELKKLLKEAVEREEYEKAVSLRDKIREMEGR